MLGRAIISGYRLRVPDLRYHLIDSSAQSTPIRDSFLYRSFLRSGRLHRSDGKTPAPFHHSNPFDPSWEPSNILTGTKQGTDYGHPPLGKPFRSALSHHGTASEGAICCNRLLGARIERHFTGFPWRVIGGKFDISFRRDGRNVVSSRKE